MSTNTWLASLVTRRDTTECIQEVVKEKAREAFRQVDGNRSRPFSQLTNLETDIQESLAAEALPTDAAQGPAFHATAYLFIN